MENHERNLLKRIHAPPKGSILQAADNGRLCYEQWNDLQGCVLVTKQAPTIACSLGN